MKLNLRFALTAILLVATALFLHGRGDYEVHTIRDHLASLPNNLGSWTGSDIEIPPETLEVLGPGDFLERGYQNQAKQEPYTELFIAYFPTQRTGNEIHSPRNCLPGSGWMPVESRRITVSIEGQAPFPANRYVIANRGERRLVLYWFLAHGRAVASEYGAKFYLVADAISLNRTDGALVRLTTPLGSGESVNSAQGRLLSFAANLVPHLDRYVPR
jgi:EpsI family protein